MEGVSYIDVPVLASEMFSQSSQLPRVTGIPDEALISENFDGSYDSFTGGPLGTTIEISSLSGAVKCGKYQWLRQYSELDAVRRVSSIKGQSLCLTTRIPNRISTVDVHPSKKARLTGVLPCGRMTCPNCASRLRYEKSLDIEHVLGQLSLSGSMYMATMTLRHGANHSLVDLLTQLQDGADRLFTGSWADSWRMRCGTFLVVKALEVNWSPVNGWHPHYHCLFWSRHDRREDGGMTLADKALGELSERWCLYTSGKLGVGFQVDDVTSDLSGYLAGLCTVRTASREVTRHDKKKSRKGSYTIWQLPSLLLDPPSGVSYARLSDVWREWEQAMNGKHQLAISKGFAGLRYEKEELKMLVDGTFDAVREEGWTPLYLLSDAELTLVRRYGVAPLLKAAAEGGLLALKSVLADYARR